MQKALFLANPNGKNVTPKKIQQLHDILSETKKIKAELVVTENISQLEESVDEFRGKEIDIVGIIGGDGTVMHTRTLVENSWGYHPIYAFFPEGTMNNVHRAVGLTRANSSLKLARYIADTASGELNTVYLPSVDINKIKGFNIGFGLIPRMLWLYYGNTARQYRELEEALQNCKPEEYQLKFEEITGKKEADFFDLLTQERGFLGAAKAGLRILKGLRRHSDEEYLIHKRITGEIKIDGQTEILPRAPTGLYISCYEEVNLGLGPLNPKPAPGAAQEPEKFQIVATYGNPYSIIVELPNVIMGERLSKAVYKCASSLKVKEKIAQVDGEFLLDTEFTVAYDGTRKVITLPSV